MTGRPITVLLAHDAGLDGGWVTDHIPVDSEIVVEEIADSLTPSIDAMRNSNADVLLVACSNESEDALMLVEWWVKQRSGSAIIMLAQASANGFVQRAFAAGADDLLVLDPGPVISPATSRQLVFALEKAVVRSSTPDDGVSSGATMICVLGPKGGIGKTVTSCNLAVAIAARRKRVVLIDLDLQFGDVALSLGLRPQSTIYDLARSGGSLDSEKVEAFLVPHPTGLRVLAAPIRPDQTSIVTAEFITEIMEALRTTYDYVVVDTPPALTPEVIAAIDASTDLCMVGMLDALSLKNTRLGLETLELMGYNPDRIRILLNRANSNVGITGGDVESILGRQPDVLVPSTRDVARSVNVGEPITLGSKRSDAAKSFEQLAEMFSPVKQPGGHKRHGFGRRRG